MHSLELFLDKELGTFQTKIFIMNQPKLNLKKKQYESSNKS